MKEPRIDHPANAITNADAAQPNRRAELEHQIAALELEVESIRDRYVRAAAELDNARKQRTREIDDERRATTREVLAEMTFVTETMDHTFSELAETTHSRSASVADGLQLIVRQAITVLERLDPVTKEPQ